MCENNCNPAIKIMSVKNETYYFIRPEEFFIECNKIEDVCLGDEIILRINEEKWLCPGIYKVIAVYPKYNTLHLREVKKYQRK